MLKYLSLFTGIGAFEKALERLGIEYDLVGYSEIDKYASKAYELIHGVDHSKALGDICEIDTSKLPKDIDMITYGFPCQDISVAGLQRGLIDDEGGYTRSGLFFEALRLIKDLKPKYAIAENVKALVSDKFQNELKTIFKSLDDAGYNNYFQVLNAKDYGVPQNRERVFIVSVRKDLDTGVQFPAPFKLEKRLKDILEDNVDERFFLSEQLIQGFLKHNEKHLAKGTGFLFRPKTSEDIASCLRANSSLSATDNAIKIVGQISNHQWGKVYSSEYIAGTLTASDYKQPQLIQVENNPHPNKLFNIYGFTGGSFAGNVYDQESIAPSLNTMSGGNREPLITTKACAFRGRGNDNQQTLEIRDDAVTNTITTVQKDNMILIDDTHSEKYVGTKLYKDYSPTLTTHNGSGLKIVHQAYETLDSDKDAKPGHTINPYNQTIDKSGISPTITTRPEGMKTAVLPIVENKNDSNGVIIGSTQKNAAIKTDGVCTTLTSAMGEGGGQIPMYCLQDNRALRIRKLTPKECFRLMGFDDADVDILSENGISNSQLYKMAGNSIVVDVIEELFKALFNPSPYGQQRLFI